MVGSKKMYIYSAIGLAALGTFLTLMSGGSIVSIVGGALSAFGAIFAILLVKYGYIILPLITKQLNLSVTVDGSYELPPSEDVIIKRSGSQYLASTFLILKIYESSTEKSLEQNVIYNEYFERAISNMNYVTKISYMVYVEDISKKRKSLETKKAEIQLRLAREREKPDPDVLKVDRYEKESVVLDHEINKLVKGEKPMGVLAYCMTSARGISKEAAIAKVKSQARELKTLLANSLNVEVKQLKADEMLKCFEWERFFPTSSLELDDEMV